jgi:LPS sulfotransferase NodH
MRTSPPDYMICTHPRSGSTYLCELLASTGKLGRPHDYFSDLHMRDRYGDADDPAHLSDQYRYYLTHGATPNGIIGTKMFWFDFARLEQAGMAHRFNTYRFVMLERADKVAQAISSSRALRSGKLTAHAALSDEHVAYDYHDIKARLTNVLRADDVWRQFAATNRLAPLRLVYEELAADPQATVDRFARHIGLDEPVPIDPARIAVRVQRDSRSAEWRERFLAEATADPELARVVASIPAD